MNEFIYGFFRLLPMYTRSDNASAHNASSYFKPTESSNYNYYYDM